MNSEQNIQILSIHRETLHYLCRLITREEASSLREKEGSWTILEIMCHLRDFEMVFTERLEHMLKRITPNFLPYDQEAMAIERHYNQQQLSEVLQAFSLLRERTVSLFKGLEPQQWQRMGIHPKRGRMSVDDLLANIVFHDSKHIRQISRVLASRKG